MIEGEPYSKHKLKSIIQESYYLMKCCHGLTYDTILNMSLMERDYLHYLINKDIESQNKQMEAQNKQLQDAMKKHKK